MIPEGGLYVFHKFYAAAVRRKRTASDRLRKVPNNFAGFRPVTMAAAAVT